MAWSNSMHLYQILIKITTINVEPKNCNQHLILKNYLHIYALVYCIGIFLSGLLHSVYFLQSFPGGSAVKNLSANSGKASSILASGKYSTEGNSNPLQYCCLEKLWRKMVMVTLYARQQKRHRCIEQSFGLCGRG